jgi:4-coumarate--CoA ligase
MVPDGRCCSGQGQQTLHCRPHQGSYLYLRGHCTFLIKPQELIKYKGLQIAPAEIEGLLDTHSSILEAAVVGVPEPSEHSNEGVAHSEIPRAYVVRAKGSNLSAEEVKEFVKSNLAPYKQLRGGVVFVDELPKNGLNKLLRRNLRDRAAKEIAREQGAKL